MVHSAFASRAVTAPVRFLTNRSHAITKPFAAWIRARSGYAARCRLKISSKIPFFRIVIQLLKRHAADSTKRSIGYKIHIKGARLKCKRLPRDRLHAGPGDSDEPSAAYCAIAPPSTGIANPVT